MGFYCCIDIFDADAVDNAGLKAEMIKYYGALTNKTFLDKRIYIVPFGASGQKLSGQEYNSEREDKYNEYRICSWGIY